MLGVLNAKTPGTFASPLLKLEEARDWPKEIAEAVGLVVIVGVALAIAKSRLFAPE